MASSPLIPITVENGNWNRLQAAWRNECERFGEDFDDYASGSFSILSQLAEKPEPKAGVYGLRYDDVFSAICQTNVATLPGYDGPVVRVRMITFSPIFDFEINDVDQYAGVLADLLQGVIDLSDGEMNARHIKFHLRSPADRNFFTTLGRHLGGTSLFEKVEVRAGWLYVTKR